MSKKFYLLFCEFNTREPFLFKTVKKKDNLLEKYKHAKNMAKFTNYQKAKMCYKERWTEFNYRSRWKDFGKEYLDERKKFAKIRDAPQAILTTEQTKRQSVLKELVSTQAMAIRYESLVKQLSKESKRQFSSYKPASIIRSLYTSQIFPAQTYKSYLSICNTQYHEHQLGKQGIGYYFTRRQEILFQRNIIIKDTSMEMRLYFRGLAYLLCDAWINGIKKLEINCESKELLKMWEDLVRKGKIGAKEEKGKEQKDGEYTLGSNAASSDKTGSSFSKVKSQSEDDTQSDDSSEQSESQSCSESNSQSDTESESQSEKEESKNDNKTQKPQQQKSSSSEPTNQNPPSTVDPLTVPQSQNDDFDDSTKKLKDFIHDYKRGYYKQEVEMITILANKFDSVKLKWLHAGDNANAVALAREKLNEELAERREKKREKRRQEEERSRKQKQKQQEQKSKKLQGKKK